jgi:hypothetical protein
MPHKPQDRNSVIVEMARLSAFLENNQLVQAHAVCQKLEGIIGDILSGLQTRAEDDPFWRTYKSCIRTKSYVLAGKTTEALSEAKAAAAEIGGNK